MTTIAIELHQPSDSMPDADTDVLIFDRSSPECQLGAYAGDDDDGPVWVDAQGGVVADVVAWCEMPRWTVPT